MTQVDNATEMDLSWLPSWTPKKPTSFEQTCIRTLHRVWFPSFSFDKLLELQKEEQPDCDITWEWYSGKISFCEGTPSLGFCNQKDFWNTNIEDLFHKPLTKTVAYKKMVEYAVDAVIFPLIGRQLIFCSGFIPESGSFFTKYCDHVPYNFMLLTDWAKLFTNPEFLQ